jgi:hypothetical protein
MKNIILVLGLLSFFAIFSNCEVKKDFNQQTGLVEVDSIIVNYGIGLTRRISKYNDSVFCIRDFTESQILSIDIKDERLFEQFRDSIGLSSNQKIGIHIFAFRCGGCHNHRDEKLVDYLRKHKKLNLLLQDKNHKNKLIDTLSLDNLKYITDYLSPAQ